MPREKEWSIPLSRGVNHIFQPVAILRNRNDEILGQPIIRLNPKIGTQNHAAEIFQPDAGTFAEPAFDHHRFRAKLFQPR